MVVFRNKKEMKKTFIFLLFLSACATAGLNNPKLESVYDGDTFTVSLPCKQEVFCDHISVRVRGVDTPEIKGGIKESKAKAQIAKQFTTDFLTSGKIKLNNCGRDKYFRLLCDVEVNGIDLKGELLNKGYAVPYDGGTKNVSL